MYVLIIHSDSKYLVKIIEFYKKTLNTTTYEGYCYDFKKSFIFECDGNLDFGLNKIYLNGICLNYKIYVVPKSMSNKFNL